MAPDLDELYAVLLQWVAAGEPRTYGDLSRDYQSRTGDRFEPHGSWDHPLGALNDRLARAGAPALSSLVILQGENEPGAGFWASAANVPRRPDDEQSRLAEWNRILREVFAFKWPRHLPG